MKVVILAGGFGTRLSEETHLKPKPLVEIGGKPILWHIMKIYSRYGFNDFVICLGYKGDKIKEYFSNYFLSHSDLTFDFTEGDKIVVNKHSVEPWKVTLVDTGLQSMTGGRIRRIKEYVDNETFLLTYGDGVANVNIKELVKFHKQHGKIGTVTAVQPAGRFGVLQIDNKKEIVTGFEEKPQGDGKWINGGFFVMNPGIFDYLTDDQTVFENGPLSNLAYDGELMAYKHTNFWQPMDTLHDKKYLESLSENGKEPWGVI
ncbi:glucose-1-phosphate cytidylyltransferase [Bacillus thuringiensis]